MQFSTVEEHAQLVERGKALLARTRPAVTLGELHLEAMRLLVASLEKRKFAITDDRETRQPPRQRGNESGEPSEAPRQRGNETGEPRTPRQRGSRGCEAVETPRRGGVTVSRSNGELEAAKRKRSRYIPAAERREVFQRDVGRCTYVDARGERCCETRYLEVHHLQAFAKLGASVATNLTLHCSAHNALAAEEDFGAQLIAERRDASRHEALAAQADSKAIERR